MVQWFIDHFGACLITGAACCQSCQMGHPMEALSVLLPTHCRGATAWQQQDGSLTPYVEACSSSTSRLLFSASGAGLGLKAVLAASSPQLARGLWIRI